LATPKWGAVPSTFIYRLIDIHPGGAMLYFRKEEVPRKTDSGGDEMSKNIGSIDRNIRIIVGGIFLLVGFFAQVSTGLRTGAFAVAAIALITAFTGL